MKWSSRAVRPLTLMVAVALAAVTGALVPASALAAPTQDSITVNWAGSPQNESGLLEISLTASTPVTSLTAQLYAAGATQPSLSIATFTPAVPGTQTSGIWTATSPIPWGTGPGELPLGSDYSIRVTASDQGGTTVTGVLAGALCECIEPTLTFSASPTTIDWAHRSVTFSGLVTGAWPDGHTGPVQGAIVTVSPFGTGPAVTATTGSDGSYTVTQRVTSSQWQASVTGGPGIDLTANTEQLASLTITPDQVRLTASVSRRDINYRQSDTVSGTVMFQSGSTWLPLSDYPVDISGSTVSATPTTNAAGQYTATLADLTQTDYLTVSAGEYSAFFTGASHTMTITVNWPVAITRVSERLSPSGVLAASGCIVFKVPNGKNYQSTSPIWVDYAPKPTGPWHVLGKMPATWNGQQMCPSVGANWTGHFRIRPASAWYRERVAAAPGIERAISRPVHLWKYPTRIVGFRVSARSVPSGGSLTVSGRLEQDTGRWRVLAHRVVLIVLRPKGRRTWYWMARPRTTASGYFSATFTDPRSAYWSAFFEGGASYFASGARIVYVGVG
ncbi:MAG: hypothetical protein ACYCO9_05160 [Streptosporangiaceae bacterium]